MQTRKPSPKRFRIVWQEALTTVLADGTLQPVLKVVTVESIRMRQDGGISYGWPEFVGYDAAKDGGFGQEERVVDNW
jgi:hypothetical protein